MAAIRWDELDNQGDESLWWEALLAEPPYGSPAGILERLERERPAWHAQALCRGRPDLDWFAAADQDATLAICATCPAVEPCRAAGRREGDGVWGGQAHRLAGTVVPIRPSQPEVKTRARGAPRPCSDCSEREARSKGLCGTCASRARRRLAGAQPRRQGKLVAACASCGEERPITGRGLCSRCHTRDQRRRAGVQPKRVGRKVVACADCGTVGLIQGQGLCRRCYSRERRAKRRSGAN